LLDGFAPSSPGPCSSCFDAAVSVAAAAAAAVAAGRLPVEPAERAVGSETRGSLKAGRLGLVGYELWA
jgi:hypothetical protein